MRVIVWTMHPARYPGVEFVELEELYRTSDVVSVHLRLSPETENFVGAAQFAMMKPNVILINTARGAIVDQHALWDALTTEPHRRRRPGCLRHRTPTAGPSAHRLGNVVLTPHCGGITPEALEAGLRMAVDNIQDFLEGRPKHLVS